MKRMKLKSIITTFTLAVSVTAGAQNISDLLSVPVINFNSTNYKLSGAQHPRSDHYKQIYLPNNQKQSNFSSMIQIEVVYSEDSIENIFQQKINELEALKKQDKTCEYSIEKNANTGEYLLNFITSTEKNKKISLVEWNAYRYKSIAGPNGTNGIMLFSITKRALGKNSTNFLTESKNNRTSWTSEISNFSLPTIKPKE